MCRTCGRAVLRVHAPRRHSRLSPDVHLHLHAVMHTLGAAPDDTRATRRTQQYCDRCTLIMTQVHDPSDSTCTAPATSADFLVPAVCWV